MTLADNRAQYSWSTTVIGGFQLMPDRKRYARDETVVVKLGYRVLGGLRESFSPDVWTIAWEENDKLIRLAMTASVSITRGRLLAKKLASTGQEVRKAKFYWSRDPDLPYRIWSAIVPESGGAPIIPTSVEDAKAKFLDVNKKLEIPAAALGIGRHSIVGFARVKWGRRSYIEKGEASGKSKRVGVVIE